MQQDFLKNNDYAHHDERHYMLPLVPAGSQKILEVGCADGAFARTLRGFLSEPEIWAVEFNEYHAEAARQVVDKLIIGDICKELENLPQNHFDLIIFNDVLEHLIDPYGLLIDIKPLLADGGLVLASLPNVRYWRNLYNLVFKKQWKYEDSGILDRTHLRFFTESSMRELFVDQGYEVVRFEGFNKTKKSRMKKLNAITFGWLEDTLYQQFMISAKPVK
jgi:2-polyprenyl-3-methyl-5-hydroxy-6-metoxy-1,4-benzoquinol methylase